MLDILEELIIRVDLAVQSREYDCEKGLRIIHHRVDEFQRELSVIRKNLIKSEISSGKLRNSIVSNYSKMLSILELERVE